MFTRKINAIKNLRAATGLGLLESKLLIEAAEAMNFVDSATKDGETQAIARVAYLWGQAEARGYEAKDLIDIMSALGNIKGARELFALVCS